MNDERFSILIVDDIPENLRVLGELLEQHGHEVLIATSGQQGLAIASTENIDLVLLDVMMPEMDGHAVCIALKADPHTVDIPVIFLTALDGTEDESSGLALGAVDFITKPFKLELVLARVTTHLALARARTELKRHNEHLEELVAERSRDLADAHERLLLVDSAKYDFLQLIYQGIWTPQVGIVDLNRRILEKLPTSDPDKSSLADQLEHSQAGLFQAVNNALLLSGLTSKESRPPGSSVDMNELFSQAVASRQSDLERKDLSVDLSDLQDVQVAGLPELVRTVVNTVVHAAVLMAQPGTMIDPRATYTAKSVEIRILLTAQAPEEAPWDTLFDPVVRFHPSIAGRTLGLLLPLVGKIIRAQNGQLVSRSGPKGGWQLVLTLPAPLPNPSVLL